MSENDLFDIADFFKVFGDSTRLKILYSLFEGEKSVGEISDEISISQSAVSHQLKYLKDSNLVKSRREGKSIIYSLADDHVKTIFKTACDHIWE